MTNDKKMYTSTGKKHTLPAFQKVPPRTALGRKLCKSVTFHNQDYQILNEVFQNVDYSSIEMRVLLQLNLSKYQERGDK